MKKYLLLCFTLGLLVVFCAGCGMSQDPAAPTELQSNYPSEEPETGGSSNAPDQDWGITLTAKNATNTGLTIVCSQSGGAAEGELQTGSPFSLEVLENQQWNTVETLPSDYEVAWTMEAWGIPQNDTVEWEVDWQWLYGELPAGTYRIGKNIMDFKGTGEYDTCTFYAEFTLTE